MKNFFYDFLLLFFAVFLRANVKSIEGWPLKRTFFSSCMKVLRGLLVSTDVDLRITAGETMALLLEAAYEYDEVGHYLSPHPLKQILNIF